MLDASRAGSCIDEKNLKDSFEQFGFAVHAYHNWSVRELMEKLLVWRDRLNGQDKGKFDCLIGKDFRPQMIRFRGNLHIGSSSL